MKLFNAITFFHHSKNRVPMKHRGISNKTHFENWAKLQGALYINYYDKKTKLFENRKWLTNDYTN